MEGLQTIWFWQPALYLFLGGMGAGAFVMAAILHFLDREGSRRVVCASSWAELLVNVVVDDVWRLGCVCCSGGVWVHGPYHDRSPCRVFG